MRHRVYGIILAGLLALPLSAQEARNTGIEATIRGQFDAFSAQDVTGAFAFASPNIKGLFGTAENFGRMVQQGYPMVFQSSSVKMLELRTVAGNLWQRVLVTDQAGSTHVLDYQMVETAEGWQINGVQLLKQAGVGA